MLKLNKMDITGKWKFKEEFDVGKDEGEAVLAQAGNRIFGVLDFTEYIEDETPFQVKCQLEGKIDGNRVSIEIVDYEVISYEPLDYYPDKREGIINANGQIVGSSEDEQGVCGVFVFEKVKS